MKKNTTIIFVLLVFIVPFSAWALMNWYQRSFGDLPVMGKTKDHQVSDFSLMNQDGEVVTMERWKNKIVVANFFFSHCPTICPQMTRNISLIQKAYPQQSGIQIISISVDPERDTPPELRKFAGRYGIDPANWELLTGEKKPIYKLARNSFMVVATDGDGGPDDFIHSEKLVLIDKNRKIRGYYDGTSSTETYKLIADIKKLRNEN